MTTICKTPDCAQTLEIKTASGYKDPKNKGKKYTKCPWDYKKETIFPEGKVL